VLSGAAQISGPSHGRARPFMWQEIEDGILPALYAAISPQAQGGAFYGPRGFYELAKELTGVSYPAGRGLPS
jgi:hypothetical protein